jgi:hypothetical protein
MWTSSLPTENVSCLLSPLSRSWHQLMSDLVAGGNLDGGPLHIQDWIVTIEPRIAYVEPRIAYVAPLYLYHPPHFAGDAALVVVQDEECRAHSQCRAR